VFRVRVPPLRERRDDVPLLVDHFIARFRETLGKPVRSIADDALDRLVDHAWPGNVRELENVIERAMILADGTAYGQLPANVVNARCPLGGKSFALKPARRRWRRRSAARLRAGGNQRMPHDCSRSATGHCSTS
jgi:DNA-binding NtrC family response regulator